MQNPLISIITVVYNGETTIKDTIESVLNQTYNNIEYIIIDGNSTDNTLKIVKEYGEKFKEKGIIYKWISEPDNGIYDAMNKGIDLANGKWINFMNSGDLFCNTSVLYDLTQDFKDDSKDVIYGDTLAIFEKHSKKLTPRRLSEFYKGMPFCHQSVFIKSKKMEQIKFNTDYTICSDYDFFYRLYLSGIPYYYVNSIISIYDLNGVSSNSSALIGETKRISLTQNKKFRYILYFYIAEIFVKIKEKLGFKKPFSLYIH